MRTDERIAEELRILRAARDGRLRRRDGGDRWIIEREAAPMPKPRRYLVQSGRIKQGRWADATITDKGRAMLADHEGSGEAS